MNKKTLLILSFFLFCNVNLQAQQSFEKSSGRMKPSFEKLLLQLSMTYFTVVKENQVDLDSSLIHAGRLHALSRIPVITEDIADKGENLVWIDQRRPLTGETALQSVVGRKHAVMVITLGAYFVFEPGNSKTNFDKGFHYLTAGIKESDILHDGKLKLAGQRLLAKLYLKNGNLSEADKLFSLVVSGFQEINEIAAAAETYSWWGLYTPVSAKTTIPRIGHIQIAEKLFASVGEKEGQINALMNEGYLHMLQYDLTNAEKLVKKSYAIAKISRFPYAHYISGALMSITMFQGKFGEPLAYGVESVESAEVTGDDLVLPYFYGAVAGLYENEGNGHDIEIGWEKKSINSFLKQHELNYMTVYGIIGYMTDHNQKTQALDYLKKLYRQVKPATPLDQFYYNLTLGNYATNIAQWDTAHKYYNKAAYFEKEEEKFGLSVRRPAILSSLAMLYYKEKNYKVAKNYFTQYLSWPSIVKGGFFGDNAGAWQSLTKIDSAIGDSKAQMNDYRRLTDVLVRNYTISKTKLAEELQVKYATAARISQISLLNQKAKLEQENLRQANLTKNITVAGILLLLVIALLLYRQSAVRKKNNETVTRKNQLMQKLLDEKEWLLKEIHHRVKNNLHTIVCLLESQAIYLENDALKAIENSRHRIYAMSLIHQKLYQSDDIKQVNMKKYLTEFVSYLKESFGMPETIRIMLDADEIKMSVGQAIPIGLIVNEAITNAFKYAFPIKKDGLIKVILKKTGDEIYLLVSDNGTGFTKSDQEINSLGLELIKGLSLDLGSDLSLETSNGTTIQLRFKYDPI